MKSLFNTTVSVGKSKSSNRVTRSRLFRSDFIENPAIFEGDPQKKDGTYYTAALYTGNRRRSEEISEVVMIVLDIDSMENEAIVHALQRMRLAHYEFLYHTTMRHTEQNPRVRVLLPPSRPMTAHEYRYVVRNLCEQFGITHDPACEVASQPMFHPMVRRGAEHEYRWGPKSTKAPCSPVPVEQLLDGLPPEPALVAAEEDDILNSLAIPAGLPEQVWLSAMMNAYPAKHCDRDSWVQMGMALYHQTGGKGVEQWITWSLTDNPEYLETLDAHQMRTKLWPSFRSSDKTKPVTIRSILAKERVGGGKVVARAYVVALRIIDDIKALQQLIEHIAADQRLNDKELKEIAREYATRYNKLADAHLSLADAMQALMRKGLSEDDSRFFVERYVWDSNGDVYIDIHSKQALSITSFNYLHTRKMPKKRNGDPDQAHIAINRGNLGIVPPNTIVGLRYVAGPGSPPLLERSEGTYLNLYNAESWPRAGGVFDATRTIDQEIASRMRRHLSLLTNGDGDVANTILQHLAHLRQRPKERIKWAFAISSFREGVGKSMLREIYQAVLGMGNVGLIDAGALVEQYNAYAAAPKLMTFIEEFEFDSGYAKIAAVKKLKNMITSDTVHVRRMYRQGVEEPATTAYAILSNEQDALSVQSTGRRWLPITVHSYTDEQCERHLQENIKEFFSRYHDLIETHPDRFVAYLESISLEGFSVNVIGQSKEKAQILATTSTAVCNQVINGFIADRRSIDITCDYIYVPSVIRHLRNEADINDDIELQRLVLRKDQSLEHLVITCLRMQSFSPLTEAHQGDALQRLSLPLESAKRPYARFLFTRNEVAETGTLLLRCIKASLLADIEARKQGTIHPVVHLNGQPFEDL